jgi:MoaA/NifB/PqqE/SkfB family radical SAM enzyme
MKKRIDRIYVEVTTACNLRCKHCFNFNEEIKTKNLDFKSFEKFYNRISHKTDGIVLTGGEPFLHPEINSFFSLLHTEQIVVTTNATVFSAEYYASILRNYPNVFMQISFDGLTREVFESVRGRNTYDHVRNVVDYLSANGLADRIGLSVSILACNIQEVVGIVDYAKEKGLHSVHFPTLIIEGRCADDMTILPEVDQLNRIEDELIKLIVESEDINISVNTLNRIAGWVKSKNQLNCLSVATIKITPDGEIMPCPVAWRKEESLGRIEQVINFEDLIYMIDYFCSEKKIFSQADQENGEVERCGMNFCENCLIRKNRQQEAITYRHKNLNYHFNHIKEEEL